MELAKQLLQPNCLESETHIYSQKLGENSNFLLELIIFILQTYSFYKLFLIQSNS